MRIDPIRFCTTKLLRLLSLTLLSWAGHATAADSHAAIELSPCELLGSGGYSAVAARCGTLTVPENPADAEGRSIDLFVAVIAAQSSEPPRDAFTFLAGGPGQAATTAFVDLRSAFELIRRKRDIVLVDQRGTGQSAPLECPQEEGLMAATPTEREVLDSLGRCLAGLDADPRFYTTSVAVDDLERVRKALGYERFDVYGGSYGTRVGLHYLRKYPQSVRTLIIDGVVPADMSLGPDIALVAQQALEKMFARCAAAAECAANFGDIKLVFQELRDALRSEPRTVVLADPVTGVPRDVILNYDRFAIATRLLSYAPESVALLPLLLFEAARNQHPGPLAAQAVMIENSLSEALSFGMHNSVVCAEDVPFYNDENVDRAALGETYLGSSQLDLLQSICKVWPAGVIDPDFKAPVISDLPVLLLSGSADPITPPAYAERAARTLRNHLHLVGKDMGHILAGVGCVPRLMARYVEEASLENVASTCVDAIAPMPFFTSFSGPPP